MNDEKYFTSQNIPSFGRTDLTLSVLAEPNTDTRFEIVNRDVIEKEDVFYYVDKKQLIPVSLTSCVGKFFISDGDIILLRRKK